MLLINAGHCVTYSVSSANFRESPSLPQWKVRKIRASRVNHSLCGKAKKTCCGWQRWLTGFSVDIWLAPFSFSPARRHLVRCLESPCPCFYAHGLRLGFPLLSGGCFAVAVGRAVAAGLARHRRSRVSPGAGGLASCTWNWWAELASRHSACLHSNSHTLKHGFVIDGVIDSPVNRVSPC